MGEAQPAAPAAPAAVPPAAPAVAPYQPAALSPSPAPPVPPVAVAPAAVPPPAPAAAVVPPPAPPAAPAAVAPPAPVVQPPAPPAPDPAKVAAPAPAAEIELNLPAGAQYDPTAIGDFKKIMADEKLTPAQRAQAVIDLNERQSAVNVKAWNERVQQQVNADETSLKADKEYGGAKFDQTVAAARSILTKSKHGPAVSALLEKAGLHKQPDIVKLFAEFKSLIAEDDTSSRLPNPGTVALEAPSKQDNSQTGRIANLYDQGALKKRK